MGPVSGAQVVRALRDATVDTGKSESMARPRSSKQTVDSSWAETNEYLQVAESEIHWYGLISASEPAEQIVGPAGQPVLASQHAAHLESPRIVVYPEPSFETEARA